MWLDSERVRKYTTFKSDSDTTQYWLKTKTAEASITTVEDPVTWPGCATVLADDWWWFCCNPSEWRGQVRSLPWMWSVDVDCSGECWAVVVCPADRRVWCSWGGRRPDWELHRPPQTWDQSWTPDFPASGPSPPLRYTLTTTADMSAGFREISHCLEKSPTPTRAISLFKVSTVTIKRLTGTLAHK